MTLTGVIIQARMSSTRLPGKVLMELPVGSGITVLEQVIRRVKKSKLAQKIIVAVPTAEINDKIISRVKKEQVSFFRGSEQNLLNRYYLAAKKYQLTTVVRVTGDCPCIDAEIIDAMVKKHRALNADYTSNTVLRTFPRGLDVEVMQFSALSEAHKHATRLYEKEHATPYIYEHPNMFKLGILMAPPCVRKYARARITLDTMEDYALLSKIFRTLYPRRPFFKTRDIINLFKQKPRLLLINKHVTQKILQ